MLVKSYPEYFGTYKVYEAVKNVLDRNLRSKDVELILKELERNEAKPNDFLKKLGMILKRHVHANRASAILMGIRDNMQKLMDIVVEPEKIELTREQKKEIKVYVTNNTDATLKFRVGVKQLNHANSAIVYNPIKNYNTSKLIKSAIIEPEKMHAYKFIIKPEIFEISDLYELKKNGKLKIDLGVQVEADGIDGFKSKIIKVPINIVKIIL